MIARSDSGSDLEVKPGRCATHGDVQATRSLPRIRFPFIIFGALRLWASTRPFRCPSCGAPVARV